MFPDISRITGLTEEEAEAKLKKDGFNEILSTKSYNFFHAIITVLSEPMLLLLLFTLLHYFALGDVQEGALLLIFVMVIIGITVYQEQKTEKALDALKNLASPRALVIRGGNKRRIPGREVVCGDTLLLSEGDRVPADGRVISSGNLLIDESLLTGESVPVRKFPNADADLILRPGGEDQPFVYSGSLVVQGQGVVQVTATGQGTEMGKIGKAISNLEPDEPALHIQTDRAVRLIAVIALFLCLVTIITYGFTRGNWVEGVLTGITLAMAIIPEEFPVVLTIFLALGAWRMSSHNVLTRKMTAIETLGSATVLCVDKTGTLTENTMTVSALSAGHSTITVNKISGPIPESHHRVVEYAILASKRDPFDPMEKALIKLGFEQLAGTEHIHADWDLIEEYPLSRELLAMANVWSSPSRTEYLIAAKGAPEAITDLCHLSPEDNSKVSIETATLAKEGLRVLGVASARFHRDSDLPEVQHDFSFEFVGLIGFLDPVRQGVKDAISECTAAGIRVMMITGDYPETARKIARDIGMNEKETLISGEMLDSQNDTELANQIREVSIVARAVPEQKLRIVQALQKTGDVVAMTGDGVNDAPALKAADIGVAMGGRGTDVAREASSLVLLDDAFASIVAAIRMGRRIYANLEKAITYIIAIHVPIAGMSVIPVMMGWPILLLPIHIVFLQLVIDPVCSVVFEAEPAEPDIMNRVPRKSRDPLFSRSLILTALMQGGAVLAVVLVVFTIGGTMGMGTDEARALTFTTIVIANICLIFVNLTQTQGILSAIRRGNRSLWWAVAGASFFLMIVLFVPAVSSIFAFAPMSPTDFLLAGIAGAASVFWIELGRWYKRKHFRPSKR